LGSFEDEHLEQVSVVVRRDSPFLIVVGDVERIALRDPGAALQAGTA
jgi:hypothetical protein